ncbi:MAG: polysaccharide deacetylase family protein [Bdellovibrio sp.]|nr:polysaccharide deacetylase family protein [Bdellovibrio sp.]
MKASLFLGVNVLAATLVVACSNGGVDHSIHQAVTDNKNAKSLIEWEKSDSHPELLFEQWRKDAASSPEKKASLQERVCKELAALDGEALSIFDNEIHAEKNAIVIYTCKGQLLEKIEEFYVSQRPAAEVLAPQQSLQKAHFQFPLNVQKRDTTNGYFAVTGDVARKEVILTFDDGPSERYTETILQALRAVNAKAIFFSLAKSVRSNPEILKKVAADGHSIGSHSITHACLGTSRACQKTNGQVLSFDQAAVEIRGGHQAVYDTLGWVDPFFRFPYGEASPELKNFLKTNSTGEFLWSIDSEDWKAQTNEKLISNTLAQIEARGRGIVLFHDIQRRTAEVLPQFLAELYSRGYSVVLLQPADMNIRYNSKLVKKKLP